MRFQVETVFLRDVTDPIGYVELELKNIRIENTDSVLQDTPQISHISLDENFRKV
jgi:hypothetical protein